MYRLNAAKSSLRSAQAALAARKGQRDLLQQQIDDALLDRAEAEAELGQNDLVQILLQRTSDFARQQVKNRLEQIVTQALTVVFPGNNFEFELLLDVKSSQPVVEYWLTKNGVQTELKPPDYSNGGGYVDIIVLALRLGIMELLGIEGPLLADEIGKHVDQENAPNAAFFLKEYAEQFGRQILLVTHNTSLAAIGDLSYSVSLNAKEQTVIKSS